MPPLLTPLIPNHTYKPTSVRGIYIHNLSSLLHACLLRGEHDRAARAWAILVRCREVDWKTRWYWGLELLERSTIFNGQNSQLTSGPPSEGKEAQRWLKTLQVSAKDSHKPQMLFALVLHLIKHERYREAMDELELYLPSPPYDSVSSLHTYAGMLAFFLAQPPSRRQLPRHATAGTGGIRADDAGLELMSDSDDGDAESKDDVWTSPEPTLTGQHDPPNAALLRQARGRFVKALELDVGKGRRNDVATEFVRLIDGGDQSARALSEDEGSDEEGEKKDDEGASSGEEDSDAWSSASA